jgi:hypothetical protein
MGQSFQIVGLDLKIISELIISLPISFALLRTTGILPGAWAQGHVTRSRPGFVVRGGRLMFA